MSHSPFRAAPLAGISSAARAAQIALAALLGLFLIGGVGFAQIEAVHNAAHDYRHSMGFPCH
jgi:cobalt transporter subunit CbtB